MARWETHPGGLRRAPRFDVKLELLYRPKGESVWRQGETRNVSRSGLIFACDPDVPLATKLDFRLIFPLTDAATIQGCGQTVRTVNTTETLVAATIDRYRFTKSI